LHILAVGLARRHQIMSAPVGQPADVGIAVTVHSIFAATLDSPASVSVASAENKAGAADWLRRTLYVEPIRSELADYECDCGVLRH
jgi:hypothetical protein